jgi:hypothetical protein
MSSSFCRALSVSVLLGAAVGCNQSKYDVTPVSGIVKVANQPLAGAKVLFAPVAKEGSAEGGKPAFGRTESDGSFHLSTYQDGDGAIVGEHWVTIFVPAQALTAGTDAETKYKRRAIPQKQIVSADQDNVINIAL